MSLRQEILPYVDEDGLVLELKNPGPGPNTGNGIHGLSVYMILLHLLGEIESQDLTEFCRVIRTCEVQEYLEYPPHPIPGLYNRGPRKIGDLIAHDDYVALAAASSIVGAPFAREIVGYGSQHCWSFNNAEPGKWTPRSFQGRRLWLITFWDLCAGKKACFLGEILLCAWIRLQSGTKDPSGLILQWLICRAVEDKSPRLKASVECWKRAFFLKFPLGIREVFTSYYETGHPFALRAPRY